MGTLYYRNRKWHEQVRPGETGVATAWSLVPANYQSQFCRRQRRESPSHSDVHQRDKVSPVFSFCSFALNPVALLQTTGLHIYALATL